VQGIAVHIAARIASLAAASEIFVSRTVKDLVAGSGLRFNDRGRHLLKGRRTRWNSTQPQAEAGNTTRIGQRGLRSLLLADIVEKVENSTSAKISLKSARGELRQEKPSRQS
jgi:hypothetical protein